MIEFPNTIYSQRPFPKAVVVSTDPSLYEGSVSVESATVGGAEVILITTEQRLGSESAALVKKGALKIYPIEASSSDIKGMVGEVIRTIRAANPSSEPSKSILYAARASSAKLNSEVFGGADDMISSLARLAGCPREFVANGVLSIASGIMTGRNHVQIRQGFRVPLTVFAVNVGDPSSQKSPCMDLLLTPVIDRQIKLRAVARSQYEKEQESSKKKLPPMAEPRLMASDCSIEALYKIAADNPGGIILAIDEFASLVNQLTRYSKSGLGDSGSYLSAYNAQPLTVDRKTQPSFDIPCWGLSIFSNCPPAVLDRFAERAELDDGFDARLWYMFPEPPPLNLRPEEGDGTAIGHWLAIVNTLVDWRIEAGSSRPLHFNDEALASFESWRIGLLSKARSGGREVSAWVGKLPGTVAKLAGLLALIDAAASGGPRPTVVTKLQLQRAGKMADLYTAHRRRVELSRGTPPIQKLVANMAGWIVDHKISHISPFELRGGTGVIPGARSKKTIHEILKELFEAHWIETPIPAHHADPLPNRLVVNHRVHEVTG